MMSIPYVAQAPQSVRALAKQLYESLGKKNFDAIWPEELMQIQLQQQQQQQQQQQGVPGQQAPPGAEEVPQGPPEEVPEADIEEQKVDIGG